MMDESSEIGLTPRFSLGAVEVDTTKNIIIKDSIEHSLEPRLIRLIARLARSKGEVVERSVLQNEISDHLIVSDESLTQAISVIRQTLGDTPRSPKFIKTVPKKGYLLLVPAIPILEDSADEAVERRESRPFVPKKGAFGQLTTMQVLLCLALFFGCLVFGYSLFWPQEATFIEQESSFIEQGEVEFIEKVD